MLEKPIAESEIVLGLIGAVGTDLKKVRGMLEERLKVIGYDVEQVHITKDVLPQVKSPSNPSPDNEFDRIWSLMDDGDSARKESGDNSILALGAAARIARSRVDEHGQAQTPSRQAYIISSLKHPEEVEKLRAIYPLGFYLIGVHADEDMRKKYLRDDKRVDCDLVPKLIARDEDGKLAHGQRVTDTFHLSDFFVRLDDNDAQFKKSI